MGQGQSAHGADPLTYHSLDPRSKVGKRASMRVSLLTAEERAELVRRSIGMKASYRQRSGLSRSMSRIPDPTLDKNTTAKIRPPPLAGTIQGSAWNNFVHDLWGQEHRSVFHTIILPPDRDPRDVTFYKPTITKENRYFLPAGQVPETVTNPTRLFEAYVEKDIREKYPRIPPHFLINNARPTRLNPSAAAQ